MISVRKQLYLVFILFVLVSLVAAQPKDNSKSKSNNGKKKAKNKNKDWKKINYDEIEKDWEKGDDKVELESEYDRIRKIQQSKLPKIDKQNGKSPAAMQDALKKDPFAFSGGGGGSMIFVDLKPRMLSGSKWTTKDLDFLAGKWAHLLKTGSLTATVYNIDKRNLLVNVDRAWMTKDIMKFISMQPEVESFTLQNKKYTPADFQNDDDDDDL